MHLDTLEPPTEENARLSGEITRLHRENADLKAKVAGQEKFVQGVRERHQEIAKRYISLSKKYNETKNRLAEVQSYWINRQIDTLVLGDQLTKWRLRPLSWEKITAEYRIKPPKLTTRNRLARPEHRTHHTVEAKLISLI